MGMCIAIDAALFTPASRVVAGLSPAIDEWLARALRREPTKRFESAAQMAEAFARLVEAGEPSMTVTPPPPSRWPVRRARRAVSAIAVGALAVLGVQVAPRWLSRSPETPTAASRVLPAAAAAELRSPPSPTPPSPVPAGSSPPAHSAARRALASRSGGTISATAWAPARPKPLSESEIYTVALSPRGAVTAVGHPGSAGPPAVDACMDSALRGVSFGPAPGGAAGTMTLGFSVR